MKNNGTKSLADKIISYTLIGTIIAVVIATAGYLFVGSLLDKGYFKRKNIAAQSQNYTVDNCMFSYFFYENYRNLVNMEYDFGDKDIDLDKSIKKQDCYYEDCNWYDYFLKQTENQVEEYLTLAEKAKASGVKLTDEELDNIDSIVDKIKDLANQDTYKGAEYYTAMYGRGVTAKDIKNCLKLERLALKYKAVLRGDFTVDDAVYEKSADKNENKSVDVYSYVFKYDEYLKLVSDNSTFEEFKSAVIKDMAKNYTENYGVEADDGFADTMFSLEQANTYAYGEDEVIDGFAFEEGVENGTVRVIKGKKETTVYCVITAPYLSEETTKNVHLIEYNNTAYGNEDSALNYANSVYGAMEEDGVNLTFIEGQAKQSTSDYIKRGEYGAYYNVTSSDFEDEAAAWIFSTDRKSGDCAVVQGEESTYIIYFDSDGLPAWKATTYETEFTKHINDFVKQNKSQFKVKLFDKNCKKI